MKCKKHPKYKAIQKPRVDCQDCLDMYNNAITRETLCKSCRQTPKFNYPYCQRCLDYFEEKNEEYYEKGPFF